MCDESYKPDQPLFWASESIDGSLSADRESRLRDCLAASRELREEAKQLERVAQLLTRVAARQPVMDWTQHAEKILARIAEACSSDESLDDVDRALADWASSQVVAADKEVADTDMATAVLDRVRASRARTVRIPWVIKAALPLAAAAVIGLTVWPSLRLFAPVAPICVVQVGPQRDVALGIDENQRRSSVRFVRLAGAAEPRSDDGIGLLSVGADERTRWRAVDVTPPL